ncbi:hypothetical protein [Marinomonas epiphytica]
MLYAKVNEEGDILDVSTTPSDEYQLLVAPDDPIVALILDDKLNKKSEEKADTQQMLSRSDADMMRVLEDLVELLIEKRLIQFTELPLPAQKKLLSRKWVRGMHSGQEENLMADDEFGGGDSLI